MKSALILFLLRKFLCPRVSIAGIIASFRAKIERERSVQSQTIRECRILIWVIVQVVKRLLLEHGWPENFRRDAYLDALRQQHPDDVAYREILREYHPHLIPS